MPVATTMAPTSNSRRRSVWSSSTAPGPQFRTHSPHWQHRPHSRQRRPSFRGRLGGEAQLYFGIGGLPGGGVQDRHGVAGDGLGPQALLFGEGRVHRPLLGLDDAQAAVLQEVVDGHCGLAPLGHGLDEGGRPQDRVAAGEDAGAAGDQGVRIHLDETPAR